MSSLNTEYPILNTSSRWLIPERTEVTLVDQLLKNRGITDRVRFVAPDFSRDSHSPWLLPTMEQAVDRIIQAIERIKFINGFIADRGREGLILNAGFNHVP